MVEYTCAFNATLIGNDFGCRYATPVTRRSGPDVACVSEDARRRCEALFRQMKAVALPVFGVEDDPLTMPHSVQVKIQFGGLLGLQRVLEGAASPARAVANVAGLVEQAAGSSGAVDAILCQGFVQDMVSYRLRRRASG